MDEGILALNVQLLGDKNKSKNIPVEKKIFFVSLFVFLLIYLNNFGIFNKEISNETCYQDLFFDFSKQSNEYYAEHQTSSHRLLIISSTLVDILVITTFTKWIFNDRDNKLFIILGVFYGIRGLIQSIFLLGFPSNYLFEYPGTPSIFIGYDATSDFFYSGHVGFSSIFSLYYWEHKEYIMSYLSVFVLLVQIYMMICLRGHYSIDLIIGILMAHYSYKFTKIVLRNLKYN